jgi:hypothetical protein
MHNALDIGCDLVGALAMRADCETFVKNLGCLHGGMLP